jgi:hypothetical protein
MGPSDCYLRLRLEDERAQHAQGHDERHGRNARGHRRQTGARLRQRLLPGHGHSRDGHGADGVVAVPLVAPLHFAYFAPSLHVALETGTAMIGLVAVVVATVILVFFGIGYALGRLFL